ncbi:MAG TPA: sigma factor-like helix-turn-helix DNA-binding protein [Microthrixaceae bacterium]|nr:sigma factor-like helix-turn-helix DNA-binding protein [Microthrixaceae bacterium]
MGESRTADLQAEVRNFEDFVATDGARLRRVLVAREGMDVGSDLCAEALAAVWKDWDRVGRMSNPAGYAYRVAQSANRRHRRWGRGVEFPREELDPAWEDVSGDIFLSLGVLKPLQRTCVVLVHAHGWSYREVAEILDISVAAVTNHVHRGMQRLRRELGEER